MNEKQKTRWLKRIVLYCIAFTSVILVAGYVASWWGVDTYTVTTCTCSVFGGELLITGAIKLFDKNYSPGSKTKTTVKPAAPKEDDDLNG